MVNNKSLNNGKALCSSKMEQKSTDTPSTSGQPPQANGRASLSLKRKLNKSITSRSPSTSLNSSSKSSSSSSKSGSSSDPNFSRPARKVQKRGRQSANKTKSRQGSLLPNALKPLQNSGNQPIPPTTQQNRKDFRKNLAPRVKEILEASFAKGETPSKNELENLLKSTKLSKDDIKYWFKKERSMQTVRDKPIDEKKAINQKEREKNLAKKANGQPAKVKLSRNEATPILEARFVEDPEVHPENMNVLQEKTGWGRLDIKNWYYARRREENAKNGRTRSKITPEQIKKLEELFEKNQFLEQTSKELEGIVTFQYANNWFLQKKREVLESWLNGTIDELPWQMKNIEEYYGNSGSIANEDMKKLAKKANISCFQIKRYLSMRRSIGEKTRNTIPKRNPRGAKEDSFLGSLDSSKDKEEDVDVGDEDEDEEEEEIAVEIEDEDEDKAVENENEEEKEGEVEDEEEEVERGVGDEDEEEEEREVENEDFDYENRDADRDYEFNPDNVNILETDGEEEFNGEEEADRNGDLEFNFQRDDGGFSEDDGEEFYEDEEKNIMNDDFQYKNDEGNIRRDHADFQIKPEVEEDLHEMDERIVQELQHEWENGNRAHNQGSIPQEHDDPNLDWRFAFCHLPHNKNINYKEWTNRDFMEFGSYFLSERALEVLEAKQIKGTDAKQFVNKLANMFFYINKEDFEAERSPSFSWKDCLKVKYHLNILFSLVDPVDE